MHFPLLRCQFLSEVEGIDFDMRKMAVLSGPEAMHSLINNERRLCFANFLGDVTLVPSGVGYYCRANTVFFPSTEHYCLIVLRVLYRVAVLKANTGKLFGLAIVKVSRILGSFEGQVLHPHPGLQEWGSSSNQALSMTLLRGSSLKLNLPVSWRSCLFLLPQQVSFRTCCQQI